MADPGFGVGRAPCGGWPDSPKTARGSCYQHQRASQDSLPFYRNVTKMTDLALGTPGGITIIPRRAEAGLGGCAGSAPAGCGTTELCGSWRAAGEAPSNVESANQIDFNAYELDPAILVNHSRCRILGFWNVQAKRSWHGAYGPTSEHWQAYTAINWPTGTNSWPVCWCRAEQLTASQTKYRTVTSAIVFDSKEGTSGTVHTGTASRTVTVNATSGVQTLDACTNVEIDYNTIHGDPSALLKLYGMWNAAAVVNHWTTLIPSGSNYVITKSGNTWTVTDANGGAENGLVIWEITLDFAGGHFVFKIHDWNHAGSRYVSFIQEVTMTATQMVYYVNNQWDYEDGYFDDNVRNRYTITTDYSVANAPSDVEADVVTLLAAWDMGNQAQYPARTDGFTGVAPLVSRVELAPVAPDIAYPNLGEDCLSADNPGHAWVDPEATRYNGGVKGSPNAAGHDGHFDFNHRTTFCCKNAGTPTIYIGEYGAKSGQLNSGDVTDLVIPAAATQWTENGVGGDFPNGAWAIWQGDVLWAQKWAEVKLPWKSYNYARPCGADRFLMSESTVRCVESLDSGIGTGGSPWAITVSSSPSASPVVNGDVVIYCGGSDEPTITAVCTATKIDATHFTLVKICNAPPREDCGTGIFGKVRFNSAPGICGRNPVLAATNTNPIQITVLDAMSLRTGDAVDIAAVTGNTAANVTNATITVIDANTFTLDGVAGSGVFVSGGYAVSHGATSYTWDDDQSKGDFIELEYTFNYRDYQERDTAIAGTCGACSAGGAALRVNQGANGMPREVNGFTATTHCLAFTVCDPQVMCVSPNAESFNNLLQLGFNWPTADGIYGNRWQRLFVQQWPDFLWEAPAKTCVFDSVNQPTPCAMTEDDGSCELDSCDGASGNIYYPHRPMREASNLVGGTPALPSGLFKNIHTYAQLQDASPVDGFTIPPPAGAGYPDCPGGVLTPKTADMPWTLYMAEYLCVCAEGTFGADYEAEGAKVKCPS